MKNKIRIKAKQKKARKTKKEKTIEGKISINKRGVGYISTENLEQDLEISPKRLNTALPYDTVRASIKNFKNGKSKRIQGEVKEILSRFRKKFVGEIQKENNYF